MLYAMVLERVQWMPEEKDRAKAMEVLEWSDSTTTLRAQDAAARSAAEALGVGFTEGDWQRAWEIRQAHLAELGITDPVLDEDDSTSGG